MSVAVVHRFIRWRIEYDANFDNLSELNILAILCVSIRGADVARIDGPYDSVCIDEQQKRNTVSAMIANNSGSIESEIHERRRFVFNIWSVQRKLVKCKQARPYRDKQDTWLRMGKY